MCAYIPLVTGDSLCGQPVLSLDSPCWDMLVLERGWTPPAHNPASVSWLSRLCPGPHRAGGLTRDLWAPPLPAAQGRSLPGLLGPVGGLECPFPFSLARDTALGPVGPRSSQLRRNRPVGLSGDVRPCQRPALGTSLPWPCSPSLWRGGRPLAGSRAHGAARRWAEGASPAGRPRGTAARPT